MVDSLQTKDSIPLVANEGQTGINQKLLFVPEGYNEVGNPVEQIVEETTEDKVGIVGSVPGSFSVTQTGAANYSIPISCPSGVGGMKPGLSIDYNSSAGNGIVGYGASVNGISSISRADKSIYHDGVNENLQWDNTDVFTIDGKRLFEISNNSGTIEYRVEGDPQSKVIAYECDNSGPGWFKVWSNDGKIRVYGHSDNSRYIMSSVKGSLNKYFLMPTGVEIDEFFWELSEETPFEEEYCSSWYLEEIIDTYGNSIIYTYLESSVIENRDDVVIDNSYTGYGIVETPEEDWEYEGIPEAESKKWSSIIKAKDFLLDNISYAINDIISTGTYQVKFNYEGRSDEVSAYLSGGHEFILEKRLASIDVKNLATNKTLSTYSFEYKMDKYSKLVNVGLSAGESSYIPTTLDWGTDEDVEYDLSSLTLEDLPSDRKKELYVGDFNGDGKSDLFVTYADDNALSSTCKNYIYYFNYSNSSGVSYAKKGSGTLTDLGAKQIMVYDVDNDGEDEVVYRGTYSYKVHYECDGVPPPEELKPRAPEIYEPEEPVSDCYHQYSTKVLWHYNVTNNGLVKVSDAYFKSINFDDDNDFYIKGKFKDNDFDLLTFNNEKTYQGNDSWPGFSKPDAMDIINFDGDKKQDIIQIKDGVYRVIERNTSGVWQLIKSGTMLKESYILPDIYEDPIDPTFWDKFLGRVRYHFENDKLAKGDFNSDGLTDFLIDKNGTWKILYGTGDGYIEETVAGLGSTDVKQQQLAVFDVNGDGKSDIIKYSINSEFLDSTSTVLGEQTGYQLITYEFRYNFTQSINFYINEGCGIFSMETVSIAEDDVTSFFVKVYGETNIIPDISSSVEKYKYASTFGGLLDMNGDGFPELVLNSPRGIETVSFNNVTKTSKVKTITKATGQKLEIEYESLAGVNSASVYSKTNDNKNYTNFIIQPGMKVVSKTTIPGLDYTQYFYKGLVYNRTGKGVLGFSEVNKYNSNSQLLSKTYFDYYYRPYSGTADYISMNNVKNEQYYVENPSSFSFLSTDNYELLSRDILEYDLLEYNSDVIKMPYIKKSTTKDFSKDITNIKEVNTLNAVGMPSKTTTIVMDGTTEVSRTVKDLNYATKVFNNFTFYTLSSDKETVTRLSNSGTSEPSFTRNTSYIYYDNCVLKEKKDEPGTSKERIESYTYDTFGNTTSKTINDVANNITRSTIFNFTTDGRFLESTVNELGHTISFNYDQTTGKVTEKTDPNGLKTNFYYDDFGQLYKTAHPNGIEELEQKFWAFGRTEAPAGACYFSYKTASGTAPTIVWYDMYGRELRLDTKSFFDKDLYVSKYYDSNNRLWKVTEPYYSTTDIATVLSTKTYFDKYGREVKNVLPNNKYVETVYADAEHKVECKIGRGEEVLETTTKYYNALGDIVESIDNLGNKVTFQYYNSGLLYKSWVEQSTDIPSDGSGVVNNATSKSATAVVMEYDIYGNRTKMDDPNAGIITSTYNAFGEVLTTSNSNSHKSSYLYDDLGRVTSQITVDESNNNEQIKNITYVYDTRYLGLLSSVTDHLNASSQENYFDEYGRVSKTVEKLDAQSFDFSYTYDDFSRQKTMTYPNGYSVINEYNKYGDIEKVLSGDDKSAVWEATAYNERGQLTGFKQGDLIGSNTYNSIGEINVQQVGSLFNMSYDFDDKGNLTYRSDNISHQKEEFAYDELDRLSGVTYLKNSVANTAGNRDYYYDHFGNLTDPLVGNQFTSGTNRVSNATSGPHALDEIIDAEDIRTNLQNQTVTYNSDNKVTSVNQALYNYTLRYGYDGQRRYAELKKSGAIERRQFYFGLYEELYDNVSGEFKEYCYIPTPRGTSAVMIADKTTQERKLYQVIADYLGSVQCVVNNDDHTDKVMLSFDAWGNTRNAADWTLTGLSNMTDTNLAFLNYRGFTGHEHIVELDLINMNGRVYDPLVKRFLSPDPYIQLPEYSQNYNRYSYCFNNPLKFVDPSGEEICFLAVVAIATAIGMGSYTIQVACSDGGFDNWDWDYFLIAGIKGAISGAMAYGVGTAFGGVGGFVHEVGRAVAHAHLQGCFSAMTGGDYATTFATSVVSSGVGSALAPLAKQSIAAYIAFDATIGGATAEVMGGNFWEGFATSLMIVGLNHTAHIVEEATSGEDTTVENEKAVTEKEKTKYKEERVSFKETFVEFDPDSDIGIDPSPTQEYSGYLSIKKGLSGRYYVEAFAESFPGEVGGNRIGANVRVLNNGKDVGFQYLSMRNEWGSHFYSARSNRIGYGRVYLPDYGANVTIRLNLYIVNNRFFTGTTSRTYYVDYNVKTIK